MTHPSQPKTRNKWRTQYQKIESASKFHNRVREIFATDRFFRNLACYQEVNVQDLIHSYPFRSHHFDWYIDELQTVVELHGDQHYKVVNYGNIGIEEAQRNHIRIKDRDNTKKLAATEAGYDYVAIPYKEYKKLNAQRLKHLIFYGDSNE